MSSRLIDVCPSQACVKASVSCSPRRKVSEGKRGVDVGFPSFSRG